MNGNDGSQLKLTLLPLIAIEYYNGSMFREMGNSLEISSIVFFTSAWKYDEFPCKNSTFLQASDTSVSEAAGFKSVNQSSNYPNVRLQCFNGGAIIKPSLNIISWGT